MAARVQQTTWSPTIRMTSRPHNQPPYDVPSEARLAVALHALCDGGRRSRCRDDGVAIKVQTFANPRPGARPAIT